MIEVEAKIKVSDPAVFRRRIKKIANFVNKEKKIDDYYTLESLKKYPLKSLRIRKKGNIHEINFKQRLSYANGVHAKNEKEFILKDVEPFLELIRDFGFKQWLRKEKSSETYEISKNFHIEINYVKHLGWFSEIEYLCEKKDIEMARKKVLEIINGLNISKKDIVKEGYTRMLWDKGKLGI